MKTNPCKLPLWIFWRGRKKASKALLALALLLVSSISYAAAIKVVVPSDVYQDYLLFLAGRDPAAIQDFSGTHSRRDVVEVVLFSQALRLGGWQGPIYFSEVDSYQRTMRLLSHGDVVASATTMFTSDISAHPSLLQTQPVVEQGEFEVGLYLKNSSPMLKQSSLTLDQIKALKVVSNKQWSVDWSTLEILGFNQRMHTTKWQSQVKMVDVGRADALLAPFQASEEMSLQAFGVTLKPLSGIKLGLQDSRRFVISRSAVDNRRVFLALEKGLTELKRRGVITQAYQQSGFLQSKVADWQLITP
ncbi:hypothetical protein [Agarivorans sp. Alg241-V36]|uniref:hypothetical protein n=1 Tax=Agarivorans sp. Alg241-V36 TaxID=2305992 RepID=UPI0013D14519|nr:hypothetical protein [Agarivorans sp. Alg241-V36]